MATKVNINGKLVTRPGVYTLVKSGIQNPAQRTDYGAVLLVDDGIGANWGGGQGGQVYEFETPQDFQSFVKGGVLFDLAQPLFKPVPNKNIPGVSKVILIQARDTTAATITLTFTNGSVVLTPKDQGLNANGGKDSNNVLRTGYAAKFIAGKTTDTYILQIWHGSYKGTDPLNNAAYDGVSQSNAAPILITQSPEVANLAALQAWLQKDVNLNTGFTFTVTIASTGDLVPGDLTSNTGYILASGATETYSATAFANALTKITSSNANFVLGLKYNGSVRDQNNLDILSAILDSKYEKHLIVAGGGTAAELTTVSIPAAQAYNSDRVVLVHGDGLLSVRGGFKVKSQLWKAANVLGRLAGLTPQTPLTLKSIGIDAEADVSKLDEKAQENALANGVLVNYYDDELGYEVVLQGINTLQSNEYLVNEDGTSFSIAVRRIVAQLNKDAAIYLKRKFFGKDIVGPNRNTITEADLEAAMEGYLQSRVASTNKDDLIINFQNITATVNQDNYYIGYEFTPNFEVNKLIVTGTIIDKSANA